METEGIARLVKNGNNGYNLLYKLYGKNGVLESGSAHVWSIDKDYLIKFAKDNNFNLIH